MCVYPPGVVSRVSTHCTRSSSSCIWPATTSSRPVSMSHWPSTRISQFRHCPPVTVWGRGVTIVMGVVENPDWHYQQGGLSKCDTCDWYRCVTISSSSPKEWLPNTHKRHIAELRNLMHTPLQRIMHWISSKTTSYVWSMTHWEIRSTIVITVDTYRILM